MNSEASALCDRVCEFIDSAGKNQKQEVETYVHLQKSVLQERVDSGRVGIWAALRASLAISLCFEQKYGIFTTKPNQIRG